MDPELLLRWLHVIGACVLLGTGAGIAFFMAMAHRTGDPALIAGTARIVVIADLVFTATAAIAQPLTGWLLARQSGWDLTEGWIAVSLALYALTGVCWLPVVRIQIILRDLAAEAARNGTALPPRYHRLARLWVALGLPAFAAVLAILWLMIARPGF
ncbi:MAG: DUF2269 domain-containing protein [Proteobacteria bacterium]|nr:DUF2269 domain-containing protein [Pseudomonadota bacterium]